MSAEHSDQERDQWQRAEAVWAEIERLAEELAAKRAVLEWLRRGIRIKKEQISSLQAKIHALHVKRNEIFHEDDE